MKYKNVIIFYAGSHSCTMFLFQNLYNFIVKQIYYENVGYNIKHDDDLYNAFFLHLNKCIYLF
jgi:hypothetical protein